MVSVSLPLTGSLVDVVTSTRLVRIVPLATSLTSTATRYDADAPALNVPTEQTTSPLTKLHPSLALTKLTLAVQRVRHRHILGVARSSIADHDFVDQAVRRADRVAQVHLGHRDVCLGCDECVRRGRVVGLVRFVRRVDRRRVGHASGRGVAVDTGHDCDGPAGIRRQGPPLADRPAAHARIAGAWPKRASSRRAVGPSHPRSGPELGPLLVMMMV